MKYAIVKNGSGQDKITEGAKIKVLGTTTKPSFEVLYFVDGANVITDKNVLKEVHIESQVLDHFRTRKLVVGRFKSKSRYDKQNGFRAEYTNVLISSIGMGGKKAEKIEKAEKADKSEKTAVETTPVKAPKTTSKKLATKEKSATKTK